jgi:dethiobiotin synthetase
MGSVIFITGTDTSVGKTVLTALLVAHLRRKGWHALACKPFSSGSLADVRILARAQDHELPVERINPFHFQQPVAPLVAARQSRRPVPIRQVLDGIQSLAARCEVLLVEGAGGLFVPLGEKYTVADLIQSLGCPVLLVIRNRLGAVNHALLTLAALHGLAVPRVTMVLMDPRRSDPATRTNAWLLSKMAPNQALFSLPFLGANPAGLRRLKENAKKFQKTLARIWINATVASASLEAGRQAGKKEKKPLACR